MKKFICVLVLLLCCNVVYAARRTAMSIVMDSWVGYTLKDVMEVLGIPTGERTIAERKLYYWNFENMGMGYIPQTLTSTLTSNPYNPYEKPTIETNVFGGSYSYYYYCNITLEVNDKNEIIYWEFEGNRCPRTAMGAKKWVNPNNDLFAIEAEQRRQAREAKKLEKQEIKMNNKNNKQKNDNAQQEINQ